MALTKATLIDLNANELILDLDADTSITADSDDTIDFRIGGSDEIKMTSSAISPATADGNALGTAALEWSDLFLADGAVINFGADQDVSLTHVHNTGLLLSSTDQLQFGDSGTYIFQSADGVLDLVSDTEIELNATTLDINANVEISGTATTTGVHTFTALPVLPANTALTTPQISTNIDMLARAELRFQDASGGQYVAFEAPATVSSSQVYVLPSADGSDGHALKTDGSGTLTWGAVAANTPSSADGQALGSASLEWSDLFLADGGQILFGNDQEITLTHTADDGLVLKHVGTGDGKEPSLTFQAGDNDIAADDVLGSIFFQAPDEGAGTDAILVAAGIEAVSEGDFSASNNATKLSFKTASSEAAAEKASLSSVGNFTISGAIWENGRTIAANHTISSSHNAMSVGPITINTGISVTVPSGSVWAII